MACSSRFSVARLALCALFGLGGCMTRTASTQDDDATSDADQPGDDWPGEDGWTDDPAWTDDHWEPGETGWTGATGDDPPETDEDTDGGTGTEDDGTGHGDVSTDTGTDGGDCDDQNNTVLLLHPEDSNSMPSPVQAREAVLSPWHSLSVVPIRAWEFFNYYSFAYPAADPGTVAVTTQMYRDGDLPENEYLLQIGVSSQAMTHAQRAPMSLTLVLDVSGSMTGQPMQLLQETCKAIAASLKDGDMVSIVTWNTQNAIILAHHTVGGPNDATLVEAIEGLAAGGGSDLHGGLAAGYQLASLAHDPSRINRVVLISDGTEEPDLTDIELIQSHAGTQGEDGIYLVGVGVGSDDSYDDGLMKAVTDAGKGSSVYIPDMEEAWVVFNHNFVSTMALAARDVYVWIDMPPGFELLTANGEAYEPAPGNPEPQDLAPNDAMVFHHRIGTCAPELVDEESEITVTARYKDAITFAQRSVAQTITFGELLGADQAMLRKGAAIQAYTQALEAAKHGWPDESAVVDAALAALAEAEAALPGDTDLEEIREVLEALD